MAVGDISNVDSSVMSGCSYVDTGMYDVSDYGAVYLLHDTRPTLIETGIGTNHEVILDLITASGLTLDDIEFICPTHVHLDHAGGAGFLAEACPNATILVHTRGVRHLVDPTRLVEGTKAAVGDQWRYYTEPLPVDKSRIDGLADGDTIDLGEHSLEAVEVPGHARHQHAFYVPEADAVFTADAAGLYVPHTQEIHPTSPPPEFDLEQCLRDIDRLQSLDVKAMFYTHFGVSTDPEMLERYRHVLTEWVDTVREALRSSPDTESAVETVVEAHAPVDEWGVTKARAETAMNVRGVIGYLQGRT